MSTDTYLYPERRLGADRRTTVDSLAAAGLLAALERGEIEVLFQPQFGVAGELVGAEALTRWQHPDRGTIGGADLFFVAERARRVRQVSCHVARTALAAAVGWSQALRLSLNVTPAELANEEFGDCVEKVLADSSFDPGRLTLEITEQSLLAELDHPARQLRRLAGLGIHIALDDFGAGFCNFRYLKELPLHAIKLDRSMVQGITEDARDLAVLRGIIAMAQALDLKVIAEGIETEEQRAAVVREGCSAWQGFLGGEPMNSDAVELMARTQNTLSIA